MRTFTRFVVSIVVITIVTTLSTLGNPGPERQMPPLSPVISADVFSISCFGSNEGAIDLSVSGGTMPYTYLWSTGDTTEDLSNLVAGSYTVTVTDADLQTATETYLIGQPAQLVFMNAIIFDATCYNGTNGGITLTTIGGTAPYTYVWSDGITTKNRSNLSAGVYSVIVTDFAGNCTHQSFNVGQALPILIEGSLIHNSCTGGQDGSVSLTINQGVSPYSFLWSNGQSTQNITALAAGIYTVTVTDANNCSSQASFEITEPVGEITLTAGVFNVSCFNMYDGAIDLTLSGGTPDYTILWNSGSNLEDISGLGPGNYTVYITDQDNHCAKGYYTITEPAELISTGSVTPVTCFNGSNGSIDLSVSGGEAPYNYFWNVFYNGEDLNMVEAGQYFVTVTDNNQCTQVLDFWVTEPSQISINPVLNQVSCFGGSNGSVDISPAGGTPPYTYQWTGGVTTEDLINKPAGSYFVTVTDAHGCYRSGGPYVLTHPTDIEVTTNVTQISCNGAHDGSIEVNATGGTPGYYYTWNDWATTSTRTNLSPGQYTVTVTDSKGCEDVSVILIYQPFVLTVTEDITHIHCFGNTDGEIIVTVNGGVSPYQYDWSNGAITPTISNLEAGAYALTVTDHKGCFLIDTFDVQQPDSLYFTENITNVSCSGFMDGSIENTVYGGTAPYTWQWSNGSTEEDLSNLPMGIYTATLTDANGCSFTKELTVTQPTALSLVPSIIDNLCYGIQTATISAGVTGGVEPYSYIWSTGSLENYLIDLANGSYSLTITDAQGCTLADTFEITSPEPITIQSTVNHISCFGLTDGSIVNMVSGGSPDYVYEWNTGELAKDLNGLAAGIYTLSVSDAYSCISTATFEIIEPGPLAIVPVIEDVTCFNGNDGSIDLNVTGGTLPILYVWSNGETTEDIFNLTQGAYSVTATDSRGCFISGSFTVNQATEMMLAIVPGNITCLNGSNGSIDLNVTGGTAGYSFLWNTGDQTEDLAGLEPGTYAVTVTDAHGCQKTGEATLTEPSEVITATSIIDLVNCTGQSNGSVDITPAGGTLPYTYLWSDGSILEDLANVAVGTYTVTISDASGACTILSYEVGQVTPVEVSAITSDNICFGWNIGAIDITVANGTSPYTYLWNDLTTSDDRTGLIAGIYTLTVTDLNGCTATATWEINQPDQIIATGQINPVSCFNGTNGVIDITVTGGVPGYTYLWDDASILGDRVGMPAGTYALTVTDAIACTSTFTFTIGQPAELSLSQVVIPVGCTNGSNGSIDLSVTGGTSPYTYLWSNGETTEDIENLSVGVYDITVTDVLGCIATGSVSMTEPVEIITITEVLIPVSCPQGSNGEINLTPANGTEPYTYLWNTGETTEDLTGLAVGSYTVTVSDFAGNCTVKSIQVEQVPEMTSTVFMTPVTCNGNSDGSLTVGISNGNPPFTYAWDNGDTDETIEAMMAGTYTLTVTDDAGCTLFIQTEITQPEALNITYIQSNASCFGIPDGSIDITITGGVGPYTVEWMDGFTEEDRMDLTPGFYNLTVRDANGCKSTMEFEITEPQPVTGTIDPEYQTLLCSGDNVTPITFIPDFYLPEEAGYFWYRTNTEFLTGLPQSGTGPLNGSLTNITTDPQTATFVIVSTVGGCEGQQFFATIDVPSAPGIEFIYQDVLCYGGTTTLRVEGTGGTPPYTGEVIEELPAGTYEYTLTDFNGCVATASVTINQPDSLELEALVIPNTCSLGEDGIISMSASGGTPPYYFNWADGPVTQNRTNLPSGIYEVTVTDDNACQTAMTVEVGHNYNSPTGFLGMGLTACNNLPHEIQVFLTGTPPWTIRYSNGYDTLTKTGILHSPYSFNLQMLVNTELSLISVSDLYCEGLVLGGPQIIQVYNLPTASLVQPAPACPGDTTLLEVHLTGTGPWSLTWSDGSNHTMDNITESPVFIPVNPTTTKTYSLVAISDIHCSGFDLGTSKTLVVYNKPTALLAGNEQSCSGEPVNLSVNLTGTAPWQIIHFDGTDYDTISGITTSPFQFTVAPEISSTYVIHQVSDSHCTGITSGSATVFVHPRPSVAIQALDTICTGETTSIFFHLTGTPPWNMVWNDGQPHSVFNITSSPYTIQVEPGNSQTYVVTVLQDFYCNAVIPGPPHYLTVSPRPTASMSAPSTSCMLTGVDLTVNLTGTPPWSFTWNDTEAHTITGVMSNPHTIHITPNNIGTYWLTQVSDANCQGEIISMPFQISILPSPDVTMNVQAEYVVCAGSSITVNGQAAFGIPPFSLSYSDENGQVQILENLPLNFDFTINPPLTAGTYAYMILSIADANGCMQEFNQPFTVYVVNSPFVHAGEDISLSYGQSTILNGTVSGGTDPVTISWEPPLYLSDPSILSPVCTPLASTNYTLIAMDANGCQHSDMVSVFVDVSLSVYGVVTYDNTPHTPLNDVIVKAFNPDNIEIARDTADAAGFYDFLSLPAGNYTLRFETDKAFGGVNATDALLIMKHFVQITLLEGLKIKACDVDGSGYINSLDALVVAKRFTGQTTSYVVPDWIFSTVSFSIPALQAQNNVLALCAGDANGSFIPETKAEPSVTLTESGLLPVKSGQEVRIPIRMANAAEINAVSLVISTDPDEIRILGLSSDHLQNMIYSITPDETRISWYSIKPVSMNAGDILAELNAKIVSSEITKGLSILGLSELADANARAIESAALLYPKLILDEQTGSGIQMYPNPAKDRIQIILTEASSQNMVLEVLDAMGKQVMSTLMPFAEGNVSTEINVGSLRPGVYTFRVKQSSQSEAVQSTKVLIIR